MSRDNTRNSAIAVDVRFRSGKSPHTILKRITRTTESFRIAGDFHDRKWYRKGSVFQYGDESN